MVRLTIPACAKPHARLAQSIENYPALGMPASICGRCTASCGRIGGSHVRQRGSWERRWIELKACRQRPHSDRQIIFSAIQPTGIPHLGNYLGALREWVRLQNSRAKGTKLLFSIADLHSLTVPQDASLLREQRKQTLATLLAVGLDPAHCTLFYQSDVRRDFPLSSFFLFFLFLTLVFQLTRVDRQIPEHSELMWILSTIAPMGYLTRMTQWKVCDLASALTVCFPTWGRVRSMD